MNVREVYLKHRSGLTIPAQVAYQWAQRALELQSRIEEVGFQWKQDRHYNQHAHWSREGFELQARVVPDNDAWWTDGVDTYGEFTRTWKPGAIRHHRGGSRDCRWFVPVNPEYGRQDYDRACEYGHSWSYIGVTVTAGRAGITLGEASLWGIESDSGEDYLTEVALLELADDAVAWAREALCRLCA